MVTVAALAFATAAVDAQIYEWRDSSGSRHFTNNRDGLPVDQRESARVVVAELTSAPGEQVSPAVEAAPEQPPRQAEVVYDYSNWNAGYAAGVRDGMALTSCGSRCGGVIINGPLAVARAHTADAPRVHSYPYHYPLVTTSFDRGRSRHLTLRMLLQEQFQLDRDGPFVFERLNPVGLGPALQPILPRGLPQRFPREGRVLFR